jgi:hypothetical protein
MRITDLELAAEITSTKIFDYPNSSQDDSAVMAAFSTAFGANNSGLEAGIISGPVHTQSNHLHYHYHHQHAPPGKFRRVHADRLHS